MGLGLANCVTLSNAIEFFKQHTLQRLRPKVEQYRPRLRNRLLVYVYEVELVDVAVHKQVLVLLVHLCKLLVAEFQILEVLLILRLGSFALVALTRTFLL